PGHHAARHPVGPGVRRRVRLGLRDLRLGARLPQRRVRQELEHAPAAHVLPARRRHPQRRLETRRDRLVPGLHHGRHPARGPGPGWPRDAGVIAAASVGGVTAHRAVGTIDDAGTGPDLGTLYRIASISKVFTALALAIAVRRGEVDLDAPADDYLPAAVRLP